MSKIFHAIISLCLLMVILPHSIYAQEKTITGTVVTADDNNIPLQGVTVRVKGTKRFTQTDASGMFSISVAQGGVLQFSYVGHESSELKIGDANTVQVRLRQVASTLSEVVVTAMDQKRNPRELGYSVQTVKGSDIQQTQRENFVNSLQGRVAGLTVTPTTGAAGASSGIILRGFNTLSGTNQPLFIVDGIILDNQTLNSNSQGGAGIGLASDGNNRNNDNTNRIADINPNDIESLTVLKGPEATALYGSQANSGAIVITTKKAKAGKGISIVYDNNFRFQKITRFAQVNNDYGPGSSNNIPTAPPLTGQFTSFGPAWKEGTTLYDNLHHFYETGFSLTQNLALDFGTKNIGFRATGQYFDNTGVVPNNTYTKYTFKISNTTKIGKYVTITPSVSYINADNLRPLKSSTSTSGAGGYLVNLYEWPANKDIRDFETETGGKTLLFNANYNSDFDNPLWNAKNNRSGDELKRWISTLGIDINPFEWLSIAGRFGYDTYNNDGYVFIHPQSYVLTAATGGSLDRYYRKYSGYNQTITATLKKKLKDFDGRLLLGTMWQDFETKMFGVYGTNLKDSISTDSSNTAENTRRRLLRNYAGEPNEVIFREFAYFGEASLGYKNYAFLSFSLRFEKASPIPPKNNNYSYPGASLSLIMSDIFPWIKKGNIFDYVKLRGSYAQTARLNDPYSNQSNFVINNSSTVLPLTYTYGFTNNNPNLKPETQKTYEVGTEIRMLKNRISLEAAYYNTLCLDQITQGYRASYGTGYVLNTQNAASLRNEGVEITLSLNPIRKNDFSWDINFNFNHMWSKVLTLPASIGPTNDYYNSDTYISNVRGGLIRGHSTGTITGSIYSRNNEGQILINPSTGIPVVLAGNYLIADRIPDFSLGTLNSFRYKNWSLNFLWDLRVGGDIYNGTDQILTGLGKSARTANRSQPLLVQGVLNDGKQNTATPTVNTLAIVPQYLSSYYTSLPDEEFIQHDVDWFRLRDITLTYSMSDNIVKRIKGLKRLSLFLTGNDLILITNYYGADPAVNSNNPGTAGVGGYGMDLGSAPTPISFSFGLKAGF